MLLYTILLLIIILPAVDCSTIETDEHRLVNAIFEKYNKKLRPVAKADDVTNVTLYPLLFSIVETDEVAESITIVQWLGMKWNDAFLTWNSSDYGGMEQLNIATSEIWYPDIYVDNMMNSERPVTDDKNYAAINNDGAIAMFILEVLTTHCEFHIIMFPFDIQNCTMIYSSWSYSGNQMDVVYNTPTDMSAFNPNSDWNLISMTARKTKVFYGEETTPFVNVYYDIVIQRKPTYYLLIFVLPCFMTTTVSIIGIFAPFNDAGERQEQVMTGLTTLLTMTVILTLIADKMPKSSEGLPLLGTYVMLQIAIGAVTSLTTVIVMYLNRKSALGVAVPAWILTVTRLGHMKGDSPAMKIKHQFSLACNQTEKMDNDANIALPKNGNQQQAIILKNVQSKLEQIVEHLHNQSEEENLRKEWQHATQRLDLILMITFLAFNCIVTICLLVFGYSNLRI